MGNLKPLAYASSVETIDFDGLLQAKPEIEGVVFDIDKTLVGQHEETIPKQHLDLLTGLYARGLRLGIISNASSKSRNDRVMIMADSIGDAIDEEVAAVTSLLVHGKKKPLRPIFDELSRRIAIPNERLLFIGDQLLKDVLGANLAGYAGAVLVAPYGHGDDPAVRLLQRPAEAVIRPFLKLPLRTKDF